MGPQTGRGSPWLLATAAAASCLAAAPDDAPPPSPPPAPSEACGVTAAQLRGLVTLPRCGVAPAGPGHADDRMGCWKLYALPSSGVEFEDGGIRLWSNDSTAPISNDGTVIYLNLPAACLEASPCVEELFTGFPGSRPPLRNCSRGADCCYDNASVAPCVDAPFDKPCQSLLASGIALQPASIGGGPSTDHRYSWQYELSSSYKNFPSGIDAAPLPPTNFSLLVDYSSELYGSWTFGERTWKIPTQPLGVYAPDQDCAHVQAWVPPEFEFNLRLLPVDAKVPMRAEARLEELEVRLHASCSAAGLGADGPEPEPEPEPEPAADGNKEAGSQVLVPSVVRQDSTLMHLLPKQGRGPPLRPRENATYTDGFCECLGEAPSAAVCEQKALGAGQYKSFVYFEVGTAAGPRWERLCYGRTDRAFNPYPQPGTVSGFAVTVCRSEDDCELNGRCEAGRCRCDSGWKGDSCGQLDLLPAKAMPDNGYNRLHEKPAGYSSWGGSIIRDDESGLFHMFAAEMDKSCGINLWYPNSRCIRATARSFEGPFEFAEVVKPSFCHEPVVLREPAGKFLVWHVGRQDCPDCGSIHTCAFGNGTTDCQGSGVFNASGSGAECYPSGGGYNHSYHDGLGIMSADSLEGPWQSMYLPNDPSLFDTNPAPFVFPNGTAILLTRQKDAGTGGGQMRIRVGRAPHWSGPWDFAVALVETGSEDPHLFRNPARGGSFHAVFHHNNYAAWPLAQGTHAFSRDGLSWKYSSVTAYSGVIQEVGGQQAVWKRRERPHILQSQNGSLLALTTGVGNAVDGWTIGADWTWTHVQPIRVR